MMIDELVAFDDKIVYNLIMIMMTVHDSDKTGKSKMKSQICLKISEQERVEVKQKVWVSELKVGREGDGETISVPARKPVVLG